MTRVLFVFAWLVVGGEETEVRLLAKQLEPTRYQLDVVACLRKPGMPEQTHEQLRGLGVNVDKTPYNLSFEDTVTYLAGKIPNYDVVVSCQAVPDIYPALERIANPPPLIEHGGLVAEAQRSPKNLTSRYVGVCKTICDAAVQQMPDRPDHVVNIPSMVDLEEFADTDRTAVRKSWRVNEHAPVIGCVGRLDRKKRVEDFIQAAALVNRSHPQARFVVIGGPDAFMPEYAEQLQALGDELGLQQCLQFLGDCPDVPKLLSGLDIFVWLSRDEGMPHVISEAGAAYLPVIATRDNGAMEQITDGVSGLFVPYESPEQVARMVDMLICNPSVRRRLGNNLRRKVEREYSAQVLVPCWETLFQEVIAETRQCSR